MATRIPPSIQAAFEQANVLWPGRAKQSDGKEGDPRHQAKKTNHNPDGRGIVHAFDLTHDPARGVDCDRLAAHPAAVNDPRVKYLTWNRRRAASPGWAWVPHTGEPHDKHMHVSIHDLEWHKHAATDNVSDRLKDWHRGVTVCDRRP